MIDPEAQSDYLIKEITKKMENLKPGSPEWIKLNSERLAHMRHKESVQRMKKHGVKF